MSGKINWTCAYYYPFFLGATCFLITLYKFFLPPFILLLKPFLLIIFTILLLAMLLRFGRPNSVLRKDQNEKLTRKSSLKLELGKRDVIRVRKVESFRSNPNIRSRRTFKGTTVKAIAPDDKGFKEESRAIGEDDVNPINAASISSSSSPDEDHVDDKISETEDTQQSSEKLPACGCDHENIADRHEDACATETENVESCLGSPWCRVEHRDDRFDSEFSRIESSDLSAENGAGMDDKVDPRFSEDKLKDAATEQNHTVDDGGVKVESGKKDDEDVEGAREEKNQRNKVSITWTADDQRNLMDLGDSEHERSRRLESLIAKRKARKAMERNLVDSDDKTEALPSISIGTKRNPFDLPYDFDDSLPGSAPSRLLPRFNLFDLHCAEEEDGHKSLVTLPQRDVYRRHESFTIGVSFYENFKQVNNYFDKETKESGDAVSDSKFSFTSESDTVSVTSFQEDLSKHGKELAGQDCQCSEHVKPMDAEFVMNQMNINNDHEAQASEDAIPDDSSQESISSSLITYTDRPELKNPMDPNNLHEAHAIEDFGVVQDESSQESMSVSSSPVTCAYRGEMVDENYEADDSIAHNSGSLQDLGESTLSSNPMPVNCCAVHEVAHQVVPSQIVELDNNNSPTSTDKSNSDSALNISGDIYI